MSTIAQTMKDDAGANWTGSIRFTAWGRIGVLTGDDHSAITVTVTAGVLSTTLRGPSYYQVEVGLNRPYLVLVPTSGTVSLEDIRVGGSSLAAPYQTVFDNWAAVQAVTISMTINSIVLREDAAGAFAILFVRSTHANVLAFTPDGVNVVDDDSGARYLRQGVNPADL
jgi:hypothetical protein